MGAALLPWLPPAGTDEVSRSDRRGSRRGATRRVARVAIFAATNGGERSAGNHRHASGAAGAHHVVRGASLTWLGKSKKPVSWSRNQPGRSSGWSKRLRRP